MAWPQVATRIPAARRVTDFPKSGDMGPTESGVAYTPVFAYSALNCIFQFKLNLLTASFVKQITVVLLFVKAKRNVSSIF